MSYPFYTSWSISLIGIPPAIAQPISLTDQYYLVTIDYFHCQQWHWNLTNHISDMHTEIISVYTISKMSQHWAMWCVTGFQFILNPPNHNLTPPQLLPASYHQFPTLVYFPWGQTFGTSFPRGTISNSLPILLWFALVYSNTYPLSPWLEYNNFCIYRAELEFS